MAHFKLTLNVHARVLQKVLAIDSVELVDIEPIKSSGAVQVREAPTKRIKAGHSKKFVHPTGKTAVKFVLEYFTKNSSPTVPELARYLKGQGFRPASAHSAVQRLIRDGAIRRNPNGGFDQVTPPEGLQ